MGLNDSLHGVQDKNESTDDKMDALVDSNAELQSGMDSMKEEMAVLKDKMNKIQIDNINLKEDVEFLAKDLESATDSKIKLIKECSEQMNMLRKGIVIYQKKSKWLPFSVDFKWE